jgi:hypothetical protein
MPIGLERKCNPTYPAFIGIFDLPCMDINVYLPSFFESSARHYINPYGEAYQPYDICFESLPVHYPLPRMVQRSSPDRDSWGDHSGT